MAKFMQIQKSRKISKERLNPLELFDANELLQRYRFSSEAIQYICSLIDQEEERRSQRGLPISTPKQVCCALRYAASGSFQQVIGDTLHISKASVHRALWKVVEMLVERKEEYIAWPTEQEIAQIQQGFFSLAGFPQVVGCIDGTHIRIQEPVQHPNSFINRKYFPSINMLAICDHKSKFRYISVNWPGSCHDSFILRQTALWDKFETRHGKGFILGDSAYPCRNWLLTPYLNADSDAKERFNDAHVRTRVTIERTFGIFKRKFAAMHQEVRLSPSRACSFITFCAI